MQTFINYLHGFTVCALLAFGVWYGGQPISPPEPPPTPEETAAQEQALGEAIAPIYIFIVKTANLFS